MHVQSGVDVRTIALQVGDWGGGGARYGGINTVRMRERGLEVAAEKGKLTKQQSSDRANPPQSEAASAAAAASSASERGSVYVSMADSMYALISFVRLSSAPSCSKNRRSRVLRTSFLDRAARELHASNIRKRLR